MGQAESTTLSKRSVQSTARIASQVELEDEERVESYFSAAMVVGEGEEAEVLMRVPVPITSYTEEGEDGESYGGVSNAYYCAEKGQRFSIKCSLLRPPPEGVSFGARVYVDSGATNVAYSRAGLVDDPTVVVDTAEFDHYFWFGPNETEYVVRGFYRDSETSFPFIFGSPDETAPGVCLGGVHFGESTTTKTTPTPTPSERLEVARSLGAVRIQFTKVKKWLKKKKQRPQQREHDVKKKRRIGGAASEWADAKGAHVAAIPAKITRSTAPNRNPTTRRSSRPTFSSSAASSTTTSPATASKPPSAAPSFRGLPFQALAQIDVRRRCVDTFIRALQRGQLMIETDQRLVAISQSENVAPSLADATNSAVPVPSVADAISRTLSPAAAYLVCVGKRKEGNYGEREVQSSRAHPDPALDRDAKIDELQAFFTDRPDHYDLRALVDDNKENNDPGDPAVNHLLSGYWFPTMRQRNKKKKSSSTKPKVRAYAVSFAAIVVLDDDDDED
ncbi:hypothetical protein CTAYLR_009723 [Chrysophaeum taylorii]|uniref:Uncharacterized protein n=1 Tax=Chrysophaeum taylorii TaxID=2483200 RepID=A0AAD7XL58_9STRA|nr:hypothetical protein CTAYLR_009723 [Chrysophaeum taylorii]